MMRVTYTMNRRWAVGCLVAGLAIAGGCAEVLESYGEAPTIEILSGPEEVTSAASATFELDCVSEGACEFECALDSPQFERCEPTVTYEALDADSHIFAARAIDASGRSSEPASWEWTIEDPSDVPGGTEPTLEIIGPETLADGVATATLTFQFSADVEGFEQADIVLDPAEHRIGEFTAFDANTFQATLTRIGNQSGALSVSVASGAYTAMDGASGEGASLTIELIGENITVEECDVPEHVELSTSPAVTTFGDPSGLIEFMMPPHPTVLSHPFTTTDDPNVGGQVDVGGSSQTSLHRRRAWISTCAGGEPISGRCDGEGNLFTMRWVQGESRTSCLLETNTTYHFNLA